MSTLTHPGLRHFSEHPLVTKTSMKSGILLLKRIK